MTTFYLLLPVLFIVIFNLPFGKWMRSAAPWLAAGLILFQTVTSVTGLPAGWAAGLATVDGWLKFSAAVPDQFGQVMMFSVGVVSAAALAVGYSLFADEPKRFSFLNLLLISKTAMTGIILSQDLFSVYVFLEITSIASFVLISLNKDKAGLSGAYNYIVLSALATVFLLGSIGFLFLLTGGTGFADVANAVTASPHRLTASIALGFLVIGLFIKGGIVPFHGWLPDAYANSPAAVSVLLAGIVTKVSGLYTLIRLVALTSGLPAGLKEILLAVGALSVTVAAVIAVTQTNFKRVLAWSSISQIGYIVLGFATGSALGIAGAVFHILNHSLFKSLLFVNAAAVEKRAGTLELASLGGLQSKMPVTSSTSLVAALSTAGVPPLAGFWSKLLIIMALWQSHQHIYALIAILASVLTLAYLLIIQARVFWGKLKESFTAVTEAGPLITVTSVVLALLNIGVGLGFPFVFDRFFKPIKDILFR